MFGMRRRDFVTLLGGAAAARGARAAVRDAGRRLRQRPVTRELRFVKPSTKLATWRARTYAILITSRLACQFWCLVFEER